jgi:2'-5' RNA ligase
MTTRPAIKIDFMLDMRAVILMPPPPLFQALIAFSQALNASGESSIRLSDTYVPHLTIVQTDAPLDFLRHITQGIQNCWSDEDVVTLAGFCFVPEETRVWLEVPTLKSRRLTTLRNRSVEELELNGFHVLSGVDDSYRPHLTVALMKTFASAIPPLDPRSLRASVDGWTLAVSELEDNYVVNKEHLINV